MNVLCMVDLDLDGAGSNFFFLVGYNGIGTVVLMKEVRQGIQLHRCCLAVHMQEGLRLEQNIH